MFFTVVRDADSQRSQIEVKMSSQTERVVNPVIFRIFWQSARKDLSVQVAEKHAISAQKTQLPLAMPVIKIR